MRDRADRPRIEVVAEPLTPREITAELGLRPLPVEGGLWAQSWRDEQCSAIHYLLVAPERSALHRLTGVEVYSFHAGSAARVHLLWPDGRKEESLLGTDLAAGQRPQVVVPAGVWQAVETLGGWSLLGTVVVPPYTGDSVEFGDAATLAARHPEQAGFVREFSR